MKQSIVFFDKEIPKIDLWKPNPEDIMFTNTKGMIFLPIADFLKVDVETINCFYMNPKKCYNSQTMRDHTCDYLNYFEKYYDPEKTLFVFLAKMKYVIDFFPDYNKEQFLFDIRAYILGQELTNKVLKLVEYNYALDLSYKNIADGLQYNNDHAKILLTMSILMNFCIPLITHYAYTRRITDIDDFIMEVFDIILHMFPVDIYSKLYETAISNVGKSEHKNSVIWAKQDIRGKDIVTHSYASVNNIILNIMPKYTFNRSIVALNYTSIQKNTSCQVLDIEYEFQYIPLSSSKRDEDNVSDFDKHEANLTKTNEALYLQTTVNSHETMRQIESMFGPFDMEEINFYKKELDNGEGIIINNFQKQLIFNIFYKYFGDTVSIYGINNIDYIKLMIAAKKLLKQNYMVLLPYIISGKVEKLVGRKTVNKKEMLKLQSSSYYPLIMDKYRNEKIVKQILSVVATIISSDFKIIDYYDKSLHGKRIETFPDMIIEEVLVYTLLI